MTSKEKALLICEYLSSKKAKGIVYIAVEHKTSLCDYFVVAGGTSKTHVKSLGENLEEFFDKQHGLTPPRRYTRRQVGGSGLRRRNSAYFRRRRTGFLQP